MISCPKCGSKFKTKREYCINCGYVFDLSMVDKFNDSESNYFYYYFDEYKIKNDLPKVNVGFIFFPLPMFFYYKMYSEAIVFILMILHMIFALTFVQRATGPFGFFYILFSVLIPLVYYIWNIFKLNDLRKKYAYYKIGEIQRENKDKSNEEIIEIIKKYKKHNNIMLIIGIILTIILAIIFMLLIFF